MNEHIEIKNNPTEQATPQPQTTVPVNSISLYEQAMAEKRKKTEDKKRNYEKISSEHSEVIKKIFVLNVIVALLSAFFFAGKTLGFIGLFGFTAIISILLVIFLLKESLVESKKSFLWLVPINLIAFSNALFTTNLHWLNIIVIHILFSVMFIQATNTELKDIFDIRLFISSLKNFLPNFLLTSILINKAVVPKEKTKSLSNLKKVVLGLVLVAPVMIIVLILLSIADENFADLLFNNSLDFSIFIWKFIYFVFATLIFFFYSSKIIYAKYVPTPEVKKLGFDGIIFSTALFCLNFIYLIFLYIQAKYFVTNGLLVLPEGFTYSEYANDGFIATFLVTLINFGIIILVTEFTKINFENIVFKINFGLIFLTNSMLIFTAFIRTYIYIDVYGYTTTRLSVILVLILQFILMVLLLSKVILKIQFYKVATFILVGVYILQAYVSNDFVVTHLNFNKFDITAEDDIRKVGYVTSDYYERSYEKYEVTKAGTDHKLSFNVNADSSAYILRIKPNVFVSYLFGETNPYYSTLPFFSRTIFELQLEKELDKSFYDYSPIEDEVESSEVL